MVELGLRVRIPFKLFTPTTTPPPRAFGHRFLELFEDNNSTPRGKERIEGATSHPQFARASAGRRSMGVRNLTTSMYDATRRAVSPCCAVRRPKPHPSGDRPCHFSAKLVHSSPAHSSAGTSANGTHQNHQVRHGPTPPINLSGLLSGIHKSGARSEMVTSCSTSHRQEVSQDEWDTKTMITNLFLTERTWTIKTVGQIRGNLTGREMPFPAVWPQVQ